MRRAGGRNTGAVNRPLLQDYVSEVILSTNAEHEGDGRHGSEGADGLGVHLQQGEGSESVRSLGAVGDDGAQGSGVTERPGQSGDNVHGSKVVQESDTETSGRGAEGLKGLQIRPEAGQGDREALGLGDRGASGLRGQGTEGLSELDFGDFPGLEEAASPHPPNHRLPGHGHVGTQGSPGRAGLDPLDLSMGSHQAWHDSSFQGDGIPDEPKIRMEILTPRQVNLVLLSLWLTTVAALVVNTYEQDWLRPRFRTDTTNATCFNQFSGPVCVSWQGLNCSSQAGRKRIQAEISGLNPFNTFVSLRGEIVAENASVLESCRGLLVSKCRMSYEATITGRKNGSSVVHMVDTSQLSTNIFCHHDRRHCDSKDLYVQRGPLTDSIYTITLDNITIDGSSICSRFGNLSSLELNMTYLGGNTMLIETIVRWVLLLLAVVAWLYWLRCIFTERGGWKDLLPEQRWITCVLGSLLLLQDPFFALKLFYGGLYSLFSMASYSISLGVMLTFWLCMVEGMGKNSLEDVRPWSFYGPKLLFGVSFSCSIMVRNYLSSVYALESWRLAGGLEHFEAVTPSPSDPTTFYNFKLSVSGKWAIIPWAVLSLTWMLWFSTSMLRTSTKLEALPYLRTRYRQLSFRFFVLQSVVMSMYLFFDLVGSVLWSDSYFLMATINYNSLPQAMLFEVYLFLVALIYLPVEATRERAFGPLYLPNLFGNQINRQRARLVNYTVFESEADEDDTAKLFCLERASAAVRFSWRAYLDPSALDQGGVSEESDIESLGYQIETFVYEAEVDIGAIICVESERSQGSRRQVVVAFRGSNSVTNAMLDMDFRRTNVPKHRLQPRHRTAREHLIQAITGFRDTILHPVETLERGADVFLGMLDGVKVHTGFWQAYEAVSETILKVLVEDRHKIGNEDTEYLLTGHSLGGALAQLLAVDLKLRLGAGREHVQLIVPCQPHQMTSLPIADVKLTMYSFGAPRVGNRAWSKLYNALAPSSFRVVFRNDFVSTVPSPPLYTHGGQEVILDAHGNIKCDPSFVEKVFRPSRNSFNDHLLVRYRNGIDRCLCVRSAGGTTGGPAGGPGVFTV